MILENGVIRTLEPGLPLVRALPIAGHLVAGGVGTHETALASPERVDLGGRCVLPGFTDSHVHFPTWALAQRQIRLEDTASLDEALAARRRGGARAQPGRWLRGTGWRAGDWSPPTEPTKEALDRVTGDTPTALMARDYHSLWLNSAALAHANGDLDVEGGVVVRDERGEPTGVLREECAWHFRDEHVRPTEDEMVEACPRRRAHRDHARRHRGARQGRLARRARRLAATPRRSARCTCACGSRSPPSRWTSSRRSGSAAASATTSFGSAT